VNVPASRRKQLPVAKIDVSSEKKDGVEIKTEQTSCGKDEAHYCSYVLALATS